MNSHKMSRHTIVLVFVSICSLAWGNEPNDTSIPPAFEISSTARGPYSSGDIVLRFGPQWRRFANAKPGYVAAIPITGPTEFWPLFGGRAFFSLVEQQVSISEGQRALLKVLNNPIRGRNLLLERSDPNDSMRVCLYAVTLEDAQKMAQAYLQCAVSNFRHQIDGLETLTDKGEEQIAEAEKRLSELGTLAETTAKSLEELRKEVPYRMVDEAQAAIGELDRVRNAAQVEVTGIRARIEAIQEYQQQRIGVPAVTSKLQIMFIEESVALKGAAAREKMAMHLREQASRFFDLECTLANTTQEKARITEDINSYRNNLKVVADQLESARELEPQIPDRVVICPVAWIGDDPNN